MTKDSRPGPDALRQWQALQLSKLELDLQQTALNALQQRAEEERAGHLHYEQLFQQAPACCYALDMNGRIVSANQAGAALMGQPSGMLLGEPFERFLAPEEQSRWRAFASILQAGNGRAGMDSQLYDGIPGAGPVRVDARLDVSTGLCCVVIAAQTQAQGQPAVHEQIAQQVAERTAVLEQENADLRRQLALHNETSQTLLASQAQLRLLGEDQAVAVEAARTGLARSLHEQVGKNLVALRLDVARLRARTHGRQAQLHQCADGALSNVDATLHSVRGIMDQLRPSVLDMGLQAALDWQLAAFRKDSGMACTLDAPDDAIFAVLNSENGLLLFRQLQAALATVQRHSGASAVAVSLRMAEGAVHLVITDDGAGGGSAGPAAWRRQRQALSMLSIAERLRAHRGSLEVQYGESGQGCRISLRLPLQHS